MFTKSIYTSISRIKRFSLKEGESSWLLERKPKNDISPVYVPPSQKILLPWKEEQNKNMSHAPNEMNNSLSQLFPWSPKPEVNTQSSYRPDITLANWEKWSDQTIKNLENSKVELEGKIKAIDEKDFLADPLEYQNLKNELHVMNKSLIQEYENEYDRYEEQEDLRVKKLKEWEQKDSNWNDRWVFDPENRGDIDPIQEERIQTRSDCIDRFLGNETWSGNIEIKEEKDGENKRYFLYQDNVPINNPKWTNFSTRREANRAEIRYRLFSEPPLDIIRDSVEWPRSIDKLLLDTDIRKRWNIENPNEPFHAKWLRRLILVALLKKMNPEKYWDLSYSIIIKWEGNSLQNQFHKEFQNHRWDFNLTNGSKSIENIMKIIKDENTWKKIEEKK